MNYDSIKTAIAQHDKVVQDRIEKKDGWLVRGQTVVQNQLTEISKKFSLTDTETSVSKMGFKSAFEVRFLMRRAIADLLGPAYLSFDNDLVFYLHSSGDVQIKFEISHNGGATDIFYKKFSPLGLAVLDYENIVEEAFVSFLDAQNRFLEGNTQVIGHSEHYTGIDDLSK